jgi:predicted amidohydrolase
MARKITVAAAQLGPIHTSTLRSEVTSRMLALMSSAHAQHAQLIVYPELALTTFFPRTLFTNLQELEIHFERSLDGDATKAPGMKPVFDRARAYGMDVSLGYAECDVSIQLPDNEHRHFNTAVYYSAAADRIIAKYRKVHLPGTFEPFANPNATNQLEKRYFWPGDLGFEAFRAPGLVPDAFKRSYSFMEPTTQASSAGLSSSEPNTNPNPAAGLGDPIVGILICNDRRWAEAWRCYGLQGAELVLCGYNTTAWAPDLLGTHPTLTSPEAAKAEALFHNKLCVQAGSYQNACWSVNVAKCGVEEDATGGKFPLIGGSCIVDPDGNVVVEAQTEGDELLVCEVDLEVCRRGKGKVFAFERHRRTEHYRRIVKQTGVQEPELLD